MRASANVKADSNDLTAASKLACVNGIEGPLEFRGQGGNWPESAMRVTCSKPPLDESTTDHACGLGDVKLDVNGLV